MTTIPERPFILVDGSSYLYRAFHALPPLVNSKGQSTGAVYGVLNMLRSLIKTYDPSYIAVVFDPKGKTFRDDLYTDYKANRPPMPDDLASQIAPLHEIIKAMGLPLIIEAGFEADDVIGTLAKQAEQQGMHTLISTGDKDMAQLVNDNVTLINTMSNKVMDPEGVIDKFGLPASSIIDYLALMGDTSDNIPGVPKVGPKTAVKWLTQYETLDNIIAHADEFKGKVGDNLRASLEFLPLSKQLTTINCEVPLDMSLEQLSITSPDKEALHHWYSELEFKRWLSEIVSEKSNAEQATKRQYDLILTDGQLQTWMKRLQGAKLISVDTETTSVSYMDARVVGLSFAVKAHEAAYLPFAHDYEGAPEQLSEQAVFAALKPILEDPQIHKVGQNLKYDKKVLRNHDIDLQGIAFDTMLESYVLNSSSTRHDMDTLALKYLNVNTIHFEDVAGKGAKQLTFNQVPLETAAPYAAEDADITLQLHETLWPELSNHKGMRQVFETIEMPLMPILAEVERTGVLIDAKELAAQSEDLGARIDTIEQQAFEVAGESFNLASPKQIQAILYDKMQIPVIKKTPKGQPSTSEAVLQQLALDYPLPKLILEHRSLAKLRSTYTDKLPTLINEKTGRVHTSYHQAVTATGRLSSSDPNLQNIPVRTEDGRRIRKAFIAPAGSKIIAADYSQIELRIMAHISQDPGLLKAFSNDHDIHQATAAEVFGVALDDVTSAQRRDAKAINFGLIYGMSAFGLSKQLGIERAAAEKYIENYFQRYPKVHEYMESTRELAHQQGYVETLFGRCLHMPEINSNNFQLRQAAERAAINAPLQGTAADIIKRAMIAINDPLHQLDSIMIMQVHDELVFEVPEPELTQMQALITDCMTGAAKLSVTLKVAIGIGDNWEEAH